MFTDDDDVLNLPDYFYMLVQIMIGIMMSMGMMMLVMV